MAIPTSTTTTKPKSLKTSSMSNAKPKSPKSVKSVKSMSNAKPKSVTNKVNLKNKPVDKKKSKSKKPAKDRTVFYIYIGILCVVLFSVGIFIFSFLSRNSASTVSDDAEITNITSNLSDLEKLVNTLNSEFTVSELSIQENIEPCEIRQLVGDNIWESVVGNSDNDKLENRTCLLPGEGVFELNKYVCKVNEQTLKSFPNSPDVCYNRILAKNSEDKYPYIINKNDVVTAYKKCIQPSDGKDYELCDFNYVRIALKWSGSIETSKCLAYDGTKFVIETCKGLTDYTASSRSQLFVVNPPIDVVLPPKTIPPVMTIRPFSKEEYIYVDDEGKLNLFQSLLEPRYFALYESITIINQSTFSVDSKNGELKYTNVKKKQHLTYLGGNSKDIPSKINSMYSSALYLANNNEIKYFEGGLNIPSELQNNETVILIVN